MAHEWSDTSLPLMRHCSHCGEGIWKQCIKCANCNSHCHLNCKPQLPCPVLHNTSKPHSFELRSFKKATHCNLCRGLLLGVVHQGYKCQECKFVVHEACKDRTPPSCRLDATPLSSVADPNPHQHQHHHQNDHGHHFIEGNIPKKRTCVVCSKGFHSSAMLRDFQCAWCEQAYHATCFVQHPMACNGGERKNIVVPPSCLKQVSDHLSLVNNGLPSHPIFVFVNPKSGGQQGLQLIKSLRYLLNSRAQVYNVLPDGPAPHLERLKKFLGAVQFNGQQVQFEPRIIVCGGDGSAGWILQEMAKVGIKIPVGLIPLGTANDLARTLGWGHGYTGEKVGPLLRHFEHAAIRQLDRWKVEVTTVGGQTEKHVMTNYFSIGVDAKIALEFHEEREANPEKFKHRFGNFLKYTKFGAGAILHGCEKLSTDVVVEVDGRKIELSPKLQSVICVNLPSYSAGVNLWSDFPQTEFVEQKIDDNIIEVVGVEGAAHLGQLRTGLSSTTKLAQGKVVKFTFCTHSPYPVQVDGEPWMQEPSTIVVSFLDQSPMLVRVPHS